VKELLGAKFTAKDLLDANIASVLELRVAGASPRTLKSSGPRALKAAGYTNQQLRHLFNARELKEAMSVSELKDMFSMSDLKDAHFALSDFLDAGYEIDDFRNEKNGNRYIWTEFALREAIRQADMPLSEWPWICPQTSDGKHIFKWGVGNLLNSTKCKYCQEEEAQGICEKRDQTYTPKHEQAVPQDDNKLMA